MSDISKEIKEIMNHWGKPDLSVIVSCKSKKQAMHVVAKNSTLKDVFSMSKGTASYGDVKGKQAINEFYRTGTSLSKEEIKAELKKLHPKGKINFNTSYNAYLVELT
jgi:hypothetical protein